MGQYRFNDFHVFRCCKFILSDCADIIISFLFDLLPLSFGEIYVSIEKSNHICITRLILIHFRFFFFIPKYNCFDSLSYIFIMILVSITNSQLMLCLMRVLHAYSVYFRLIRFSFSFLFLAVSLHSLVIHNDAVVRCGGIGRTSEEGKWIESYVGQEARQTWSARFGLWLWHSRLGRWLFGKRPWIASRPWRFSFELSEFARTSWFRWRARSAWLWSRRTLFGRSRWYSEYGYIGERRTTAVSSRQACSSRPREARTSPCWSSTTLSRYESLIYAKCKYHWFYHFFYLLRQWLEWNSLTILFFRLQLSSTYHTQSMLKNT